MPRSYSCNECGQEIVFDNAIVGKNGRPRPLNPDKTVHMHIKKPQVVGGSQNVEGQFLDEQVQQKKQEREEYWRQRDEIFQKRFELTQEHWLKQEQALLTLSSKLEDILVWLKANHTKTASKELIQELNDKKHELESEINLQKDDITNLKSALAKTSFNTASSLDTSG